MPVFPTSSYTLGELKWTAKSDEPDQPDHTVAIHLALHFPLPSISHAIYPTGIHLGIYWLINIRVQEKRIKRIIKPAINRMQSFYLNTIGHAIMIGHLVLAIWRKLYSGNGIK